MTATNMCYNFVGFKYSPPLKKVHRKETEGHKVPLGCQKVDLIVAYSVQQDIITA